MVKVFSMGICVAEKVNVRLKNMLLYICEFTIYRFVRVVADRGRYEHSNNDARSKSVTELLK